MSSLSKTIDRTMVASFLGVGLLSGVCFGAQTSDTQSVQPGTPGTRGGGVSDLVQAMVVGSLESERIVVLSAGRTSGAVLGCLVSVGDGVVAKVVESRDRMSAAVVDHKYQGPVLALVGRYARLFVVRP
jgi:hypothetical protein